MDQITLAGTGSMRGLNISTHEPVTQIKEHESTTQEAKREAETNI